MTPTTPMMMNQHGLPWSELMLTVQRQRLGKASITYNAAGEEIENPSLTEKQAIRCQIQPNDGGLEYKPEGITQKSTHIMFCNIKARPGEPELTNVKFADRIAVGADGSGNKYRVEFVEDTGGEGDHLEILLSAIEPGGDT